HRVLCGQARQSLKDQAVVDDGDHDPFTFGEVAAQDSARQGVFDFPLDKPPQWSCTVRLVIAVFHQPAARLVGQLQLELAFRQASSQLVEHLVHYPEQACLGEPMEHDDLVDTVQELGPGRTLQLL